VSDTEETITQNPRPNAVPEPQNKFIVDIELDCCGHVLNDVHTDRKTDTTDTGDGQGPTWGECPNCGEETFSFEKYCVNCGCDRWNYDNE